MDTIASSLEQYMKEVDDLQEALKLLEILAQYKKIYERKSKELYFLSKHMVTKEEMRKKDFKHIVGLLLVLALLVVGYLLSPNGPTGVFPTWNGLSIFATMIAMVLLFHILYLRASLKICTAKEKNEILKKRLSLMDPEELLQCLTMDEISNMSIEKAEKAIAGNMALYKDIGVMQKVREAWNRICDEGRKTYSIFYECGLHERQLKNDVYCKVDACE